jgi:hypothetical protein
MLLQIPHLRTTYTALPRVAATSSRLTPHRSPVRPTLIPAPPLGRPTATRSLQFSPVFRAHHRIRPLRPFRRRPSDRRRAHTTAPSSAGFDAWLRVRSELRPNPKLPSILPSWRPVYSVPHALQRAGSGARQWKSLWKKGRGLARYRAPILEVCLCCAAGGSR